MTVTTERLPRLDWTDMITLRGMAREVGLDKIDGMGLLPPIMVMRACDHIEADEETIARLTAERDARMAEALESDGAIRLLLKLLVADGAATQHVVDENWDEFTYAPPHRTGSLTFYIRSDWETHKHKPAARSPMQDADSTERDAVDAEGAQ